MILVDGVAKLCEDLEVSHWAPTIERYMLVHQYSQHVRTATPRVTTLISARMACTNILWSNFRVLKAGSSTSE